MSLKRLGVEFTPRDVEAKSTAELAEAFGRIVYDTMAQQFEEKKESRPHQVKQRPPDPRLEELRALKKDLRKSHRDVLRTGGKGSEAERIISKRWFEVVHEHAKLSMSLKARDEARRNTKKAKQVSCRSDEVWQVAFRKVCLRCSSFLARVMVLRTSLTSTVRKLAGRS